MRYGGVIRNAFEPSLWQLYLCAVLLGCGLLLGLVDDARGENDVYIRVGVPQEGLGHIVNQQGEHLYKLVLNYIAAKEKWQIETMPVALSKGVELIQRHEVELLAGLPHTAAQNRHLRLSKEAVFTTWAQVCLAEGIQAQSLLDLDGFFVGTLRDDYFSQEVQRLTRGLDISCHFVEFNSPEELFEALSEGWVSAGIADRLVVETAGSDHKMVKSSIYFAPLKYHFATSRDLAPDIIEVVDYHLKQLKDNQQSVYHAFLNSMLQTPQEKGLSRLLMVSLGIAGAIAVMMLLANAFLRRQVRLKTAALAENNTRLEEELRQRNRAEAALRQSEKQFRNLFTSSIVGIAIHTLEYDEAGRACDYRITDVNHAYGVHTGITTEAVIGRRGTEVYGSHSAPFLDVFAKVVATGVPKQFESFFQPLGKHFTISIFSPGKDQFVTVFEDISDRKKAEQDLRQSEEKYRLLIENASDGILIAQNNRIRFVNPSVCRIAGLAAEGLIDRNIDEFLHPDDRRRFAQGARPNGGNVHIPNNHPFRVANQDGETLWLVVNSVVVQWEDRPANLCFIRDITQTKRLEDQLLQSQKLQAIGTLAGGIAHDFNNLLAAIMGFTELTLHALPEDDPHVSNLTQVLSASERAKALVQQILAFSRQQDTELKPIAIAPLVGEAVQLLRASLPSTIAIEENVADQDGIVMADATQINQIVMNLGTNGAHAMEGAKGVLTIALEACRIDDTTAEAYVDLKPGQYLCLSITDDGRGMNHKTRKQIFDPYFTTKKQGEGTGLGLSVVHGIVKSLEGTILVYSEPGKGSTFRIYLPRVNAIEVQESIEALPPETGTERLLLVDDEDLVLEMLAAMLVHLGYAVTKRVSSLEALKAFEADPERYDLVISDQTMPHLTGFELAREIQMLRPGFPVIVCSGFSNGLAGHTGNASGVRALLNKPVLMQDLARTVREVLALPN